MSVLVVGLSHASAPVTTLERAVLAGDAQTKLLEDLYSSENVAGSLVLSTCNRIEVYADVDRFHGGVATICDLLARYSGLPLSELTGSAYVHYEDRAVQHLLSVTCGLESMVVGERQILGQVRQAVTLARQRGTLGRELSDLGRLALRAGKRAHAETGIDAAGQNLVTFGLDLAAGHHDRQPGADLPLDGLAVLVVGAGSMSSLAVATATRLGAAPVVIANRTRSRAERLAARYGATTVGFGDLEAAMASADLVITCTGSAGHVITAPAVAGALAVRREGSRGGTPFVLLDLALPRDVESEAGDLPGVRLIDLVSMGGAGPPGPPGDWEGPAAGFPAEADVAAVRAIVAQELAGYLKANRAVMVAPTVVALRAKAASVVESEMDRLDRRLGDLDARTRREIAHSMGRIADKLLHGPTVRVKDLAGSPGADSYEAALRVLFELDPEAVEAVGRPDGDMVTWQEPEAGE